MRKPLLVLLVLVGLAIALGLLLRQMQRGTGAAPLPAPVAGTAGSAPAKKSLLVYCAAGLRLPMSAVAARYEQQYGVVIDLQYGGSGTLLNNLRLADHGDLFLAADETYITLGREQGVLAEAIPVARMTPVLAVLRGNPKGITGLADLLKPEIRLALANPEAASIGAVAKALLSEAGQWSALDAAVRARGVYKPTVGDLASDLRLGTVDAAIVWDATVRQADLREHLEIVPLAGAEDHSVPIMVSVLRVCRQPSAALHFARYLAASDQGQRDFVAAGMAALPGDHWAETPELLVFSGAVNRLALQPTLDAFSTREGVRLTTVYNGCGLLNGQIKLGEQPDVYQTCDASFMAGVESQFTPPQLISETPIVILTQKGNPKGLRMLADLARPGLKLGAADERQSALGALTVQLLRAESLYDQVWPQVVASTPTADLLVAQMRAGSLDAALVYEVNARPVREHLEVIALPQSLAKAVQTFAAGRHTPYPHLVERLRAALTDAEGQARFEAAGFVWRAGGVP